MKSLLEDKQELVKKLSCTNPSLPYMYGTIKTHKKGNPVRPIISSVSSASYLLSKWLTSILSVIVGTISNSHVKNTMDLVSKLKSHNSNCLLVSFDVESLFTKVPVHDLLEFLKRKLHEVELPVNLSVFLKLIELCVLDNVFTVNKKFYKQIFGFAMGNPLSPVLANIYMEFFEINLLPRIITFELIWYRYVDDIVCLLPEILILIFC